MIRSWTGACFEWERFVGLCELRTTFGTLLIKFCTGPQSSFVTAESDYSVFVLPVTLEVDGTSHETVERLMSAMSVAREWGMKVVLWSSTPCTGGSPWQRKHAHENPQHQERLQSFVHSAPKALEVVVEVEHPPTSECLGDGVATEMQLLGLAVYEEFPAEQGPPRRANAWVHGRHGRTRQPLGEESLESCFKRRGFYQHHEQNFCMR